MGPVFGHGQLRLYLLAALESGPRSGYDVIRGLEERFAGLYTPSAGTVYPRLAKLEEEGLVTRTDEGRRSIYSLTDAGRAELDGRRDELVELEASLDESAHRLADQMRERVRTGTADVRARLEEAARAARARANDTDDYEDRTGEHSGAPTGERQTSGSREGWGFGSGSSWAPGGMPAWEELLGGLSQAASQFGGSGWGSSSGQRPWGPGAPGRDTSSRDNSGRDNSGRGAGFGRADRDSAEPGEAPAAGAAEGGAAGAAEGGAAGATGGSAGAGRWASEDSAAGAGGPAGDARGRGAEAGDSWGRSGSPWHGQGGRGWPSGSGSGPFVPPGFGTGFPFHGQAPDWLTIARWLRELGISPPTGMRPHDRTFDDLTQRARNRDRSRGWDRDGKQDRDRDRDQNRDRDRDRPHGRPGGSTDASQTWAQATDRAEPSGGPDTTASGTQPQATGDTGPRNTGTGWPQAGQPTGRTATGPGAPAGGGHDRAAEGGHDLQAHWHVDEVRAPDEPTTPTTGPHSNDHRSGGSSWEDLLGGAMPDADQLREIRDIVRDAAERIEEVLTRQRRQS
ncbi:DNA-binding PadR family transcriptional regulator [Kineosphaera limosa]|uniref:Putative PadR family transcriptional regulator n=1 Tax=Kineosphaera limosa NBRC 100340 TaxID=1184609 RepID=K6WYB6_9MICO|nr:PadR family transcriptional regulator [Kineosphaera limosa]NYE01996.1 DNA-binding PadR family transcriptional regulator [Kineosphaera limosa]GAB97102.1 putative PadR family transcriptional regulator [Kineosphaera limosa NBRC 100340]